MRAALVLLAALAAFPATAGTAAPVRGDAFCWDFDLVGTDLADRLEGTAAPEHVASYDGHDELLLFGGEDCAATGWGNDVIHLGPGNDEADAGTAADHVYGGPGDDVILAGLGPDDVDGGEGDDLVRDERGDAAPDRLAGGPGDDVVRAANAGADAVDCGPGHDTAIVDARDSATACEHVVVARRARLTARPVRTGVRPSFAIAWKRGDLPAGGRLRAMPLARPAPRRGCAVGAWRIAASRLEWRGRAAACPGEYAFAITYEASRPGGPRVACQRLRGSSPHGCAPRERLGVLALVVV